MKNVYAYLRASTDRQEISPEVQLDQCRGYFAWKLATEGYTWVRDFRDEGVSGGVPLLNRAGGLGLSGALEAGDVVIFSKLDRGFRDTIDCLTTIRAWQARGVEVHILDVGLDTTTDVGQLILGVMALVAEFERRRMSTRMKEFHAKRRQQRNGAKGQPPVIAMNTGHQGNRKSVPDPHARAVAARLLEWRTEGWSWTRIYWHLKTSGVRRRDGREFCETNLRLLLKQELALREQEAAGGPAV